MIDPQVAAQGTPGLPLQLTTVASPIAEAREAKVVQVPGFQHVMFGRERGMHCGSRRCACGRALECMAARLDNSRATLGEDCASRRASRAALHGSRPSSDNNTCFLLLIQRNYRHGTFSAVPARPRAAQRALCATREPGVERVAVSSRTCALVRGESSNASLVLCLRLVRYTVTLVHVTMVDLSPFQPL